VAEAARRQEIHIGPQPGPQTDFLASRADIVVYGGAAGGGKSFGLLLEPIRHYNNPRFGAVIFRRNSVQVRNEGGLWDESMGLYTNLGGHPREAFLEWQFPSGSRVKFAHLELDRSVYDWQGAQIALIGWDELTTFTEKQFIFMLSRNRSSSGVPGYMRATCNPDADSWVRRWVDWWIDAEGYPIAERSGVIRYFIRRDDAICWGDSPEELMQRFGVEKWEIKSFTFIPARLQDNPILMQKDPAYHANLRALSRVDRLRLEGGNWNIRATAGNIFRAEWFPVINAVPAGWIAALRFWDRAATKPSASNPDPDWTRGLKLLKYPDGSYLVADLKSLRDTPGQVENLIKNVAGHDSNKVRIMSQCDPGSAGKSEAEHFVKMLAGYAARTEVMSQNKVTRAKPVSAQCEVGNIRVLRAPWNEEFFRELENFGDDYTGHDDIVDCLSGAFNNLCSGSSILNAL
jgi:predicted phage terminase large subunit-like protein